MSKAYLVNLVNLVNLGRSFRHSEGFQRNPVKPLYLYSIISYNYRIKIQTSAGTQTSAPTIISSNYRMKLNVSYYLCNTSKC